MQSDERRRLLAELVAGKGELSFTEAARRFHVSEMTIRRDVEALEQERLVMRVPKGVVPHTSREPSMSVRQRAFAAEKAAIASAVVPLLFPHARVLLDSGSTAYAIGKALRGQGLELTILTPSLLVASELAHEPGTRLLLTGGQLCPDEMSLTGPETVESIRSYNLDFFVMGVGGIHPRLGISDYNRDEAATKRAGIKSSDKTIVCVDHSKLHCSYLMKVASLDEVDMLVTDAEESHPTVQAARSQGVTLSFANVANTPPGSA